MALDAGEPLLCDRPIGQHAAVPVVLSLVDKRSRMTGLSAGGSDLATTRSLEPCGRKEWVFRYLLGRAQPRNA